MVLSITCIHTDKSAVELYINVMKKKFSQQPIIQSEWPPPVGRDYFAKLALMKAHGYNYDRATLQQKAWLMMRGEVDLIPNFAPEKEIDVIDILAPASDGRPLKVIVDGPPGIGKTTVCHCLCKMWGNGKLKYNEYELVLFCPLRNEQIANARQISDLMLYERPGQTEVVEWIMENDGKGLLIIFDGWDELSINGKLKHSSLLFKLLQGDALYKCSIMATSRTYASFSLLKYPTINKHVEILGLKPLEIDRCILGTLKDSPDKADKLLEELEIRDDILSICYVPMICSIVILVFQFCGGKLPTTITQLYEKYIFETIKRHLKRSGSSLHRLMHNQSLLDLPLPLKECFEKICHFSFKLMTESPPKMMFTESQLMLVESDFQCLGLTTAVSAHDSDHNQFLHLTIQEFLAAWWIFHLKEEGVIVCDQHFDNPHMHMTLRFVAGLTHLQHEKFVKHFTKEQDLSCWKDPLFGFYGRQSSLFHKEKETMLWIELSYLSDNHLNKEHDPLYMHRDFLDVHLLHLLYESQNEHLCHLFAKSFMKSTVCLRKTISNLSPFDALCFGYFLSKSCITWNHIDMGKGDSAHPFIDNLYNCKTNTNCRSLELVLSYESDDSPDLTSVMKLYDLPFCFILEESYIVVNTRSFYDLHEIVRLLIKILTLPHLKILHFVMIWNLSQKQTQSYSSLDVSSLEELKKSVYSHTSLYELLIRVDIFNDNANESFLIDITDTVGFIVHGIANNQVIQSFTIMLDRCHCISTFSRAMEQLFIRNKAIRSLQVDLPINVVALLEKVLTPNGSLINLYHKKGCGLCMPFKFPQLNFLAYSLPEAQSLQQTLQYHSNLQFLSIPVDTINECICLFNHVRGNKMLKALRVKVKCGHILDTTEVSKSLQLMLEVNETLECLEIVTKTVPVIPSTYFNFLTTGLQKNRILSELSVDIPFSEDNSDVVQNFFNAVVDFRELKIDIVLHSSIAQGLSNNAKHVKTIEMFYQCLLFLTEMLKKNKNICHIKLMCFSTERELRCNDWWGYVREFWQVVLLHPSLKFIKVPMLNMLKDVLKEQKESLILQNQAPLPKINFALLW